MKQAIISLLAIAACSEIPPEEQGERRNVPVVHSLAECEAKDVYHGNIQIGAGRNYLSTENGTFAIEHNMIIEGLMFRQVRPFTFEDVTICGTISDAPAPRSDVTADRSIEIYFITDSASKAEETG